jgi:cell division protein FtsW
MAKHTYDNTLIFITATLLIIGLAVLWSASTAESEQAFGNTYYFFLHQLTRGVLVGLVLLWFFAKFDYHKLKKIALPFMIFGLFILIAVKIPGWGFTANGATRWIELGPIIFQPAEIVKLAIIIYLASWTSAGRQLYNAPFWQTIFPPLIFVILSAGLIIWQPDLGTAISIIAVSTVMLFSAGTKIKHLFWLGITGILAVVGLAFLEPYRLRRFTSFLNPDVDLLGAGYQIQQALLAVGSGGLFGYGYGLSRQKHFYLPEVLNDSIFAVLAEELGFIRAVIILLVLGYFVIRAIKISINAPDNFGKMLAIGISALFGVNVIINISAILGLIPLTGIPLPFFSYGSTSMIVGLIGVGILLNISKQSTPQS